MGLMTHLMVSHTWSIKGKKRAEGSPSHLTFKGWVTSSSDLTKTFLSVPQCFIFTLIPGSSSLSTLLQKTVSISSACYKDIRPLFSRGMGRIVSFNCTDPNMTEAFHHRREWRSKFDLKGSSVEAVSLVFEVAFLSPGGQIRGFCTYLLTLLPVYKL